MSNIKPYDKELSESVVLLLTNSLEVAEKGFLAPKEERTYPTIKDVPPLEEIRKEAKILGFDTFEIRCLVESVERYSVD